MSSPLYLQKLSDSSQSLTPHCQRLILFKVFGVSLEILQKKNVSSWMYQRDNKDNGKIV